MPFRTAILSTHPIQYYSPWYRALSRDPEIDLTVYYAHQQTAQGQAEGGFGVAFEWDVPLLEGYRSHFLKNVARSPNVFDHHGCDTPEIAEHIARERYDAFIVHGWYNRSYWQAMRACWRTRTPLLVRGDSQLRTPRRWWRRWLKQLLYRTFIPRFDAYLVVGRRARDYYQAYGADPRRMLPAPHFVDNDFFARSADALRPRREEFRRRWGLRPDALVCLFAGKFIPKKRPLDFVAALARVGHRKLGVEGLMVGEGPLRPEIERAIAAEDAPVRLAGFLNQSAITEAYAAADLLVLPSDGGETWGLVVNEAMATGLPAVVSDEVGCSPDLVLEGQTGQTYPCGDVGRLAEILEDAARDRERWRRFGAAARRHIAGYSIESAVQGTLAALRYLHERRGQTAHSASFQSEAQAREG